MDIRFQADVKHVRVVTEKDKYALYTLQVTLNQPREKWIIERRFRDFSNLKENLCNIYVGIPDLPSKTLVRNVSAAHLEKRRHDLDEWLKVLCMRHDLAASALLRNFLAVDSHTASDHQAAPRFVGCAQDPNFGYQDAIWINRNRFVVAALNDFSLAAKVYSIVHSTIPASAGGSSSIPKGGLCLYRPSDDHETPRVFTPVDTQYFSSRVASLNVSQNEKSLYVALETSELWEVTIGEAEDDRRPNHPIRRRSVDGGNRDLAIQAFHRSDGSHLNLSLDSTGGSDGVDTCNPFIDSDPHLFFNAVTLMPAVQKVSGLLCFCGIIDYPKPLLIYAGATEPLLHFYDIEGARPLCSAICIPGIPQCFAQSGGQQCDGQTSSGRLLLLGLDNDAVCIVGLGMEPKVLCASGFSPTTTTNPSGSEFISFIRGGPQFFCGLRSGVVHIGEIHFERDKIAIVPFGRVDRPSVSQSTCAVSLNDMIVLGTKGGIVTAISSLDGSPKLAFQAHWGSNMRATGHGFGISRLRWASIDGSMLLLSSARDGTLHIWEWPKIMTV